AGEEGSYAKADGDVREGGLSHVRGTPRLARPESIRLLLPCSGPCAGALSLVSLIAARSFGRAMSRREQTRMDPLPVLLLRRGAVPMRSVAALRADRRLEVFAVDQLTPDWIAFAQRVAGVFVASEKDPMSALGYAVTSRVTAPLVMLVGPRHKASCKDLIAAGARACLTLPVAPADLDGVIPTLFLHAGHARIDGTLRLLLDPIDRLVRYHDRCVHLSQREFALLHCLSARRGRPASAEELLTYVWGEKQSNGRPRQILDVYIFQLRKKLERLGLRGGIS